MVIFFDIDGTIIDGRTQKIPESAFSAVQKLRENGHIAIINTGRPYFQVDSRIKDMAFRGYACGCGMEVLLDGNWLVHVKPRLDQREKAVQCSRKYHMCSFYETQDGGILLDGVHSVHPTFCQEVERLRNLGYPIYELEQTHSPDFVKFVTFPNPDSDVEHFLSEMRSDYDVIFREGTMLELPLKGYSKARGMQVILDHLGVSQADTLAIGDSTNDLPMFEMAAHTVCLGDGTEEVKQVCEYVTTPVMEDGIANALKHFGLI